MTDRLMANTATAEDLARGQSSTGNNLASQVHRTIFEMILNKQLAGGEQIIETRLAEMLGVSRTPLREALQRLEGEGLVRKTANRSFTVRLVDLAEYMHSLKTRELLECEAAALAVGRVPLAEMAKVRHEIESLLATTRYHASAHWRSDDNLHNLYVQHCGNPVLADFITQLRVTTRLFEVAKLKDRLQPDSFEHLAIIAALGNMDRAGVRRAVHVHMRSLREFVIQTVT